MRTGSASRVVAVGLVLWVTAACASSGKERQPDISDAVEVLDRVSTDRAGELGDVSVPEIRPDIEVLDDARETPDVKAELVDEATVDNLDEMSTSEEKKEEVCVPVCEGKECGENGCGGECGACPGMQNLCVEGGCICQPACEGKKCGDDGCGGGCGTCLENEVCQLDGTCLCIPDCLGAECGSDGCGGICGECSKCVACAGSLCVNSGPAVQWSKVLGGTGWDWVHAMAVAPDGSLFLSGESASPTVDLGNGPVLGDIYDEPAFLVKIAGDGKYQWSMTFGTSPFDDATAVAVGPDGGLYVGGSFESEFIDLGGGPLVHSSPWCYYGHCPNADMFLARFTADGTLLWSKAVGSPTSWDFVNDMHVDADGTLILAGSFSWKFDLGCGVLDSDGMGDALVARLGPDGGCLWSRGFAGGQDEDAFSLDIDSEGGIYVAGFISDSYTDLGGGILPFHGEEDAFLLKLDSAGNHLWSMSFGGEGADGPNAVSAGVGNAVYVQGYSMGKEMDFGGKVVQFEQGPAVFLVKFSSEGALEWVWSAHAGIWPFEGRRMAYADESGGVYVSGLFDSDALAFGTNPPMQVGQDDICLLHFDATGSITSYQQAIGDAGCLGSGLLGGDASCHLFEADVFFDVTDLGYGPFKPMGQGDVAVASFTQ